MKNRTLKQKFIISLTSLLILLFISILISMNWGTLAISPIDFIKTIFGLGKKSQEIALFSIRLPRILIACLVGGALAIAGTILQSVTHNELADPAILGINSGAAFFIVIYIYLTNGNNYYAMADFAIFTMPFIGLIGGLFAATIIYLLSRKNGMIKSNRLLLMGVAINAAFISLIIVAQLSFNMKDFNTILTWTSGSIWGVSWSYVFAIAPIIIIFSIIAIYKSRYLDVLNLGDQTSVGLGINLNKEKTLLLVIAVILSVSATSVAGSIAFVGLMAPHIARRIIGPRHKYLIPIALTTGMSLVVIADALARNLFAPIELHLGIVISIIGVPYFIYLLLKSN